MTPGTTKTASRKTMRVATMFTGATACAVAFTPAAAQAATIRPATTTPGSCRGPNQSHWLHIIDQQSYYCVGGVTPGIGRGYRPTGGHTEVYSFCGGNNSGFFLSSPGEINGNAKWYGHGTTYNQYAKYNYGHPYYAVSVSISRWSGNDTCPLP
jgi:hypothetical protein